MRSCFSVALNEACTNPLCVLLCSEGDRGSNTIVAYYESEFDVPPPQQASLDEAIDSMQLPAGSQEGGKGRFLLKPTDALSVNDIVTQGLTAHRLVFYKVVHPKQFSSFFFYIKLLLALYSLWALNHQLFSICLFFICLHWKVKSTLWYDPLNLEHCAVFDNSWKN